MTDIRIVQRTSLEGVSLDWLMTPIGLLDESAELATAVIVALGTDARSLDADVLPDPDATDRRGWWGDIDAQEIWDGWSIGSRLWLMERAKITDYGAQEGATLARAEEFTYEALRPFIDRRIASRMVVRASRTDVETIEINVTLYRGPLPAIELRYQALWGEFAGTAEARA